MACIHTQSFALNQAKSSPNIQRLRYLRYTNLYIQDTSIISSNPRVRQISSQITPASLPPSLPPSLPLSLSLYLPWVNLSLCAPILYGSLLSPQFSTRRTTLPCSRSVPHVRRRAEGRSDLPRERKMMASS